MTRVAGALAIHTVLDLENRKAVDAHSRAMLFRGYEIILQGRDPRDAIDISSRACGVCGGVHATVSAPWPSSMAFGICPPPLGVEVRNLGEVARDVLRPPPAPGPAGRPRLLHRAGVGDQPRAGHPGREDPGPPRRHPRLHHHQRHHGRPQPPHGQDLPRGPGVDPGGAHHVHAHVRQVPAPLDAGARAACPPPSPPSSFNEYYAQLGKIIDFCKVIRRIWDDLMDFFLEANPDYEQVGARPTNLAQTGIWDDSEVYDATYANCDAWGNAPLGHAGHDHRRQAASPPTSPTSTWASRSSSSTPSTRTGPRPGPQQFRTDPLGNPISPYHPWNKTTIPKPTATNFKDKYTWDTAPRWDRQTIETGTYGRMWTTALAGSTPDNPFFEATGDGLRMVLPRHALPETELFWPVPRTLNALERNRARAYAMAFTAAIGMNCLLKAFEYWRRGETKVHTPFRIPKDERVAVGFWEAGRGWLVHHMHMDKGRLLNYQITTPSTLNASPTDPFGGLGPYEQAIVDTPLLGVGPRRPGQGHRRPAGHPQLRPLHALHHPHGHRQGRHRAGGQLLRLHAGVVAYRSDCPGRGRVAAARQRGVDRPGPRWSLVGCSSADRPAVAPRSRLRHPVHPPGRGPRVARRRRGRGPVVSGPPGAAPAPGAAARQGRPGGRHAPRRRPARHHPALQARPHAAARRGGARPARRSGGRHHRPGPHPGRRPVLEGFPEDTVVIEVEPGDRSFGLGFSDEVEATVEPVWPWSGRRSAPSPRRRRPDERHRDRRGHELSYRRSWATSASWPRS